jgi:hypothetical protein
MNPVILGTSYIRGNKWKIEAGGGISYWVISIRGTIDYADINFSESKDENMLLYYLTLGIRYQKPTGGLMLRLGISPIFINYDDQSEIAPLPYLSLGYLF